MIHRLFVTFLCLFIINAANAETCEEIDTKVQKNKIIIPSYQSGRIITGSGRAYFYSAPNDKCKIKDTFLVPGDLTDAGLEFGDFTYVIYFHPVSGQETSGWLKMDRVRPTGTGVGPNDNNINTP